MKTLKSQVCFTAKKHLQLSCEKFVNCLISFVNFAGNIAVHGFDS